MYCPHCGKETPDDSQFCGSCGKKIDGTEANVQNDTPQSGSNIEPAKTPSVTPPPETGTKPIAKNGFKSFASTKKGKGILAGATVAIVAVIALVAFGVTAASNVPEDIAKQSLQTSSFVSNGVASNTYVEESPYTLDQFKIDKQEDVKIGTLGTLVSNGGGSSDTARHVLFSGTIKNDYFETDFTGESYYIKQGDTWTLVSSPTVSGSTTKPLKGVAYIGGSGGVNEYKITNFSSDLEENDGVYTSTATQDIEYDFWFGKDTATNTQTYAFDGTQWKATGDAAVSNTQTTLSLNGKTFEINDEPISIFSTYKGTATITFTDDSDLNGIKADYTIDTHVTGTSSTYVPISVEGTFTGKVSHTFGNNGIEIELNDSENGVTYQCRNTTSQVKAGSGSTNALWVTATTELVSADNGYRQDKLTFYKTFNERI